MPLYSPHVRMKEGFIKTVAVGLFLAVNHDLTHLIRHKFAFTTLFKDLSLKVEAAQNINADSAGALNKLLDYANLMNIIGFGDSTAERDELAENGCSLGKCHGIGSQKSRLCADNVVVPGMTQLVCEGGNPVIGSVKVCKHPALSDLRKIDVVGTSGLSRTWKNINPSVVKRILCKFPHSRVECTVLPYDKIPCLVEGIAHLGLSHRSVKVKERTLLYSKKLCLCLEVRAEHGKVLLKRRDKGVQSLSGNPGCGDGPFYGTFPVASFLKRKACPLYRIQCIAEGNLMFLPDL